MDNMITLGSLYEKALNMAKNYRDELVPAGEVCFIDLAVANIGGSLYEMRTAAQQSICHRLNIPYSFLKRCPPEIQSSNLNYFLRLDESREFFIRFDKDEVRVFLSPRFKPVDHADILDRLISLGYGSDLRVQSCLEDQFMFVNIPDERKRFLINGDRMMPGISISNSQLGMASLSISVFVLRLVCTNGMISKRAVSSSSVVGSTY